MTEFFSQKQIDDIRECFNVYSQDGYIRSAAQLRCVLRSLGYAPTVVHTQNYFNNKKGSLDFASFLEIAKEEQNNGDSLTEVIKALKGLDRNGSRSISSKELRSILSSIGEKMNDGEIDELLAEVAVNGIVPHQKLLQFISR